MLAVDRYGDGRSRRPLVIAHGLFGSGRNWTGIARRLSAERPVIVPDLRNHGESPWFDSHSYDDLAADLAPLADGTDLLGHSMGGKAAMALALLEPRTIHRLIVADIAPVAYDHSQSHLIDAMRRLDPTAVANRGEADAALAAEIEEPGVRAFLLQSLDLKERRWRLNLDVLDREMERITGWEDLPGVFEGPTLFLTGSESSYVRPDARAKIKRHFPQARFAKIPGAGHWLHAEKPAEFVQAVDAFLNRT